MAYNYFCCRKHTPPVKYAAAQPNGIPNVFASPMCPTCGKTMAWYDSGASATDPRPVPPPAPGDIATEDLDDKKISIYKGSGKNPGHGWVKWEISRNPAKAVILIEIKLGQETGGSYDSVQKFAMADGLLDTPQNSEKENWWLSAPLKRYASRQTWHEIDLRNLIGRSKPAGLPDTLQIGVKLGNAAFGLIHLLAGHASSVRASGPYKVLSTGGGDDVYRTMLLLQAGMERFKFDSILKITYDATLDKMLLKGSHSGLIVLQRIGNGPRFGITTMFNAGTTINGNVIYEA